MRRRGWKRGDYLVRDQESGFTLYASEVARDYYGVLKRRDQLDYAHPQMFVRAKNDPMPVSPVAPPLREGYDLTENVTFYVENTTVELPKGAATHLFRPGIGDAEIEYDFFVY